MWKGSTRASGGTQNPSLARPASEGSAQTPLPSQPLLLEGDIVLDDLSPTTQFCL